MSNETLDKEECCHCAVDSSTPEDTDADPIDAGGASSEDGGLEEESCTETSCAAGVSNAALATDGDSGAGSVSAGREDDSTPYLVSINEPVVFRLSLSSSGGGSCNASIGWGKSLPDPLLMTIMGGHKYSPSVSQTLQETPPSSPCAGDNAVFVESSASLPQPLQQKQLPPSLLPPADATAAARSLPRRLEISSPTVRLVETRKEGPARVAVVKPSSRKTSLTSNSSKSKNSGRLKSYRLLLTGPDLLLYRGSGGGGGGTIEKRRSAPDVTLNLASTTWLAVPGNERALHLCCEPAENKQHQRFECHIQWETPELRKAWIAALTLAKDLLINRQFAERPQQQQHQSVVHQQPPPRHTIVQRLNDFFRRRPAIDELERRGIVRSEPVFGALLSDICARDGSETPLFLRRCIAALEARGGLDTVGLYRIGGNAATVQRLRLLVDQTADYNLNDACWDVHVLASALKTFLRELRQPLLSPDVFQAIARHHSSGAKPSMRRAAVWQELQVAPGLPTLRLVFGHLARVVQHSGCNQMSARNLALVMGPNLLWQAGAANVASKAASLATDLALQAGVVEYLILEADYLFDLSRVEV